MRHFFHSIHSKSSSAAIQQGPHEASKNSSAKQAQIINSPNGQGVGRISVLSKAADMPAHGFSIGEQAPGHAETAGAGVKSEVATNSARGLQPMIDITVHHKGIFPEHTTGLVEAHQSLVSAVQVARKQQDASWIARYRFESMSEQAQIGLTEVAAEVASRDRIWNPRNALKLGRQVRSLTEDVEYYNKRLVEVMADQQSRQEILRHHLNQFCDLQQVANGLVESSSSQSEQSTPTRDTSVWQEKCTEEPCKVEDQASEPSRQSIDDYPKEPLKADSIQNQQGLAPNHGQDKLSAVSDDREVAGNHDAESWSHHDIDVSKTQLPFPQQPSPDAATEKRLRDPVLVRCDYEVAKNELAWARYRFEHRDQTEKEIRKEFVPKLGQEGTDLFCLKQFSKLTRELVKAEANYRKARFDVIQNQCKIHDSETTSVFDDDKSDGYPAYVERHWIARPVMTRELIKDWCHLTFPESDNPHFDQPLVELDLCKDELGPSDSASAIAEPKYKAKIEQWARNSASLGKMPVKGGPTA